MRRLGPVALVGVLLACGRSDLTDELSPSVPEDASAVPDGGVPITDSSAVLDATSVPPTDTSVTPPTEDVTAPSEDAEPPPFSEAGPAGCGPSTCTGCCQPDGSCLTTMSTPGPCGAHGEQCIFCNQTCLQGGCGTAVGDCNASTCDGCCVGSTICADGEHDTACGHGGVQCESCNPTTGGGQCVLQGSGGGGQCQFASSTCDSNTCPQGCCVGNVCAQGTQDIACGTGGIACTDCTMNGTTCIVSRCAGGFAVNADAN
jgi:hypothetical protein